MSNNADDLVAYDDNEDEVEEPTKEKEVKSSKGHYAGIHASTFKEFVLKAEILKAVTDCGFEHPSEVQHECIPHALLGMDVICQAKSGMGKTAVFVLASLQQVDISKNKIGVVVLCHTRELAFQIKKEYDRFTTYMEGVRTEVFYGGTPIRDNRKVLKDEEKCPHIVVGTPGRMKALCVSSSDMDLSAVKHFILDECDKMLEQLDMRRDVQEIFMKTPHDKQVMMFSATLAEDIRPVCRKFMQDVGDISDSSLLFICYAAARRTCPPRTFEKSTATPIFSSSLLNIHNNNTSILSEAA